MSVDYSTNPAVFNKLVTLLNEYVIPDSYGTPQSVWHPFATVMASIEPLSGREYWQAAQSQSESSLKIIIRYIPGVTSRTRILYNGLEGQKTYEMRSPPINLMEANRYLQLMCRELSID